LSYLNAVGMRGGEPRLHSQMRIAAAFKGDRQEIHEWGGSLDSSLVLLLCRAANWTYRGPTDPSAMRLKPS
jgi:hypothetical protein